MKKIDYNKIANISLEIARLTREIIEIFPKENEPMLKHLAASSIHMAFFARDLLEIKNGEKIGINRSLEQDFLNSCGCKGE